MQWKMENQITNNKHRRCCIVLHTGYGCKWSSRTLVSSCRFPPPNLKTTLSISIAKATDTHILCAESYHRSTTTTANGTYLVQRSLEDGAVHNHILACFSVHLPPVIFQHREGGGGEDSLSKENTCAVVGRDGLIP